MIILENGHKSNKKAIKYRNNILELFVNLIRKKHLQLLIVLIG